MIHWQTLTVFSVLFIGVGVLGVYASRWRKADLNTLNEWGLGGRTFGIVISWFLIGGDLYTAYTFIAVPALVYGKGALGMFAMPYVVIEYPLVLIFMTRLWQVAAQRGHVTASDYVKDRFNSRLLSLLIAITGIVATIPYIALQMFGIEIVLGMMGVPAEGALIAAFAVLAVFTFISGLRAPALIALVKDGLIYTTFIVAVIVIPLKLGGYGNMFSNVDPSKLKLPPGQLASFSSLALGSAAALFLYPHCVTGVLGSRSRKTVKLNMSILPLYTFLLGLIALMGYMALSMGLKPSTEYGANGIVPQMLMHNFPAPFVCFCFAAIAVGALVPASIMSIGSGNLFSRNIYREFLRPKASAREETTVSKSVAFVVKGAALGFILATPAKFVINFQLAGGVWILQTLPSVFLALYIRWLDRRAIIAGWVAGMGWGTFQLLQEHFAKSVHPLHFLGGLTIYIAVSALVANVIVVFAGTALARLLGSRPSYSLLLEKESET